MQNRIQRITTILEEVVQVLTTKAGSILNRLENDLINQEENQEPVDLPINEIRERTEILRPTVEEDQDAEIHEEFRRLNRCIEKIDLAEGVINEVQGLHGNAERVVNLFNALVKRENDVNEYTKAKRECDEMYNSKKLHQPTFILAINEAIRRGKNAKDSKSQAWATMGPAL